MDNEKNLAIELSESIANFLQPAQSSDAELVRAAVDFTLNITPEQNKTLLLYEMLSIDEHVNVIARQKIANIARKFIERQKYHDTKDYIADIIRSMSWRHFVESGAMEGKVAKNQMQ